MFKVGDKVGVPTVKLFPQQKQARSKYGYDIGEVIALGRGKKTGLPAIKVRVPTGDSVWAKRITKEPFLDKWALANDCDPV